MDWKCGSLLCLSRAPCLWPRDFFLRDYSKSNVVDAKIGFFEEEKRRALNKLTSCGNRRAKNVFEKKNCELLIIWAKYFWKIFETQLKEVATFKRIWIIPSKDYETRNRAVIQ